MAFWVRVRSTRMTSIIGCMSTRSAHNPTTSMFTCTTARGRLFGVVGMVLALVTSSVAGYPLDGYESTGISRLLHQRWVQEGRIKGKKRPPGELLPLEMVDIRLRERADFSLPESDPGLTATLRDLLGEYADRYGVALLDLSDPDQPRYAEWNGNHRQNVGSVGKILVALAIFQQLADLYPDDVEARARVLRESQIVADEFSVYDHHTVRMFDADSMQLTRRPLHEGDTASLWAYLDWMMSPSSNAAAGMLQKHLILLSHFGTDYPVSVAEEQSFFQQTPRKQLNAIFEQAMQTPVSRSGLDLGQIRQGSFFTRGGKNRVDGTSSYATARSLIQFLIRMEQGKLVDAWSSREIKRLLYITERRIRYGSSGALRSSALYFKSGSLYSCVPEEGFSCKKYHGNKRNYMNSVAVIETPAGQDRLYYMVAVISNVLRKNSAVDHRDLARAVHQRLLQDHPPKPVPAGELPAAATYGEGFIGYAEEQAQLRLKVDVQEALLVLGYEIGEIDGVIGPKTTAAIREFQQSQGLTAADGVATNELVARMKQVAQERGLARPYE